MTKDKIKKRNVYCSMIEFEQDFFPRSLSKRQSRIIADNESVGINLAKESFRRAKQEVLLEGTSATS